MTYRSSLAYALVAYLLGIFALCAVAVMLGGCATTGVTAPSAQREVYIAESDFAAALRIAVAYESLPQCGAHPAPCSDPSIVAKVTAAAKAARASLSTAQAAAQSTNNDAAIVAAAAEAQQDVAAFAALANALGVK